MLSIYTDARLGQNESLRCSSSATAEFQTWSSVSVLNVDSRHISLPGRFKWVFSFNPEDIQRRRVCLCDDMVTCPRATCNLCIQVLEHDVIFWLIKCMGRHLTGSGTSPETSDGPSASSGISHFYNCAGPNHK